jgi:hypothetical protein
MEMPDWSWCKKKSGRENVYLCRQSWGLIKVLRLDKEAMKIPLIITDQAY